MNERVRQSLLRLLNLSSLRYFGLLVYNFEFNKADPLVCPTFNVEFRAGHWYIHYNDTFASSKSLPHCIYIIIHEIVHAIAGHCFRQAGRINEFWILAIEHSINVNLDRDIRQMQTQDIQSPDDRVLIQELVSKPQWSAEQNYDWLEENAEIVKQTIKIQTPRGKVDMEVSAIRIPSTGSIYPIFQDFIYSDETEAAKTAQRDISAQARVHANTDRSRGTLGSNLRTLLKDIIEIQVPPDRILENAIRSILQKGDERTWRIPHKRLMVYDIYIPSEDTTAQLSDVIFLNDHSGSISDKEIKKFSGVMKNCAHLFQRLHIIKHDTGILKNGGITVLEREQLLTSDVLFEAVGRGGTSHKEAFEYCQKQIEKGIPISLIIGLTDWASDIEYIWDNFTFHKEVPVIWVVPQQQVTKDAKYGKILHIIKGKVK